MKKRSSLSKLSNRPLDAHKGMMGSVLIVAGSRKMPGAAILAAMSALRGGAGLVTVATPESALTALQSHLVETTFLPLPDSREGELLESAFYDFFERSKKCDSVLIGPGLGTSAGVKRFVLRALSSLRSPLLLDADALNVLGADLSFLKKSKAFVVITPHPGEMSRLLGISIKEVQDNRERIAMECAKLSKAVVVLKGYRSVITDGEQLEINTTGNPGMAKGGMGDALSGLLAAFLARGMSSFEAARLAVHIHGVAGDLASKKWGKESMIARDLIDSLPAAFSY